MGVTNNFINPRFKIKKQIKTIPLLYTIPITGLDRKVLSGRVSKATVILLILIYRYLELIKFNILKTGEYNIVLGIL